MTAGEGRTLRTGGEAGGEQPARRIHRHRPIRRRFGGDGGGVAERWFELVAVGWSPATVRHTRSVLRCQLLPHLGDVRLGDMSAERIDVLCAELSARGGQRGQPLAPGTIKRVHVVLHSALAQAMRWGWIWVNPADRAHRITAIAREPEPPTVEELTTLLDHVRARDPAFHLLLVLAATTGARRAQLLALRGVMSTSTLAGSGSAAAGSKANTARCSP